ncbi:uncharacterized protein TRUGW13939_09095 [Talaromyces rugulosus]|uniref:Uncharacterized protein n=1 Tax=Talaromyces rugulosus TaxID=121627 RepID=A0A7H8R6D6_TALRU|nr:uncharacterized protein TRUGW13939_09095 [Talaromyces rugulosus]QKX61939.1 hypothetical protein TRUGW13939_09095 [Talaromyces rugulosus]
MKAFLFAVLLTLLFLQTLAAPVTTNTEDATTIHKKEHNPRNSHGYMVIRRGNIMPRVRKLLPFLSAFGNFGQSGHKKGGKTPTSKAPACFEWGF